MHRSPHHKLVLLLCTLIACSSTEPASNLATNKAVAPSALTATVSAWSTAGSMITTRAYHALTALPDGRAVVTGGQTRSGNRMAYVGSVEIYDPATRSWSAAGYLQAPRSMHTATALANGKVLIAGGILGAAGNSVELYDPVTKTSSPAATLRTDRYGHKATLLPSGKVLVTGGYTNYGSGALNTAEVYDPATNTWTFTGPMLTLRYPGHSATLMASGKVLVVGGAQSLSAATAEVYDPATNAWSAVATLNGTHTSHAAALLPSGKVLIAGGGSPDGTGAEVYDPATNTWSVTGSMSRARNTFAAVTTPSGKVIAIAGDYFLSSTELYDPDTGAWSSGGTLSTLGGYARAAVLLSSGEVLAVGGDTGPYYSASAELYGPTTVSWASTGSLAFDRSSAPATLLPSGKVLVAGGGRIYALGTVTHLPLAELYDPSTGTWSTQPPMSAPRYQPSATLLSSGQVLVAGGSGPSVTHASAELFDPATGSWSATGSMAIARAGHSALRLPSGKVLVAGGGSSSSPQQAELYDPSTGTWSSAGTLITSRSLAKLIPLPSGKVLLAGGYGPIGPTASAEVYDPATNTWSATGSMASPHLHGVVSPLPSGKVLVAGGYDAGYSQVTTAEVYDPATGQWSATQPLSAARNEASANLLPSGKVLVTGGHGSSGADFAFSEWYDESTGTWHAAERMKQARSAHTTVPLASGQLLVLGGTSGGNSVASAELYAEEAPPQSCASQPPVLTVTGGSPLVVECRRNVAYSDPGAQAVDGCGNAIPVHAYNTGADSSGPGPLLQYEGEYTVSYSAWDSGGQTVDASRVVVVDDRTPPSLTLVGAASIVHTCNTPWQDPGVVASDMCYGDITSWVWRTGEVNAWAVGTYTLTYNVTDGGGNSPTPVTRTVQVVNCPW